MEAKQSPKHQPVVFQYLGVATVFSITYLCIASLDFVFAQILATYAAEIMLLWLALGFVALWRNNPLWLGTFFMSSLVLCNFLKESHSDTFSYAQTNQQDIQLEVAHFQLNDEHSRDLFLNGLSERNENLVSIQTNARLEYVARLRQELVKTYPYQHVLSYPSGYTLIFSQYPVRDLDTIYADGKATLIGSICVDSAFQRIDFVNTQWASKHGFTFDEHAKAELASLGGFIRTQRVQRPLLTLGSTSLAVWSPEIRSFKTLLTLNDSRADWNWQSSDAHIFYSKDIQCTYFETILDGYGVKGNYQLKPAHKSKQTLTYSQKL